MITLEMIDELRKRVDVSFEDAKEALEQNNGDILESIIYLEKNKNIRNSNRGFKDINDFKKEFKKGFDDYKGYGNKHNTGETLTGIARWIKKVVKVGNRNHVVIKKEDKIVMNIPLTFLAIGTVFAFYIVIPLLLLAMFTGHKINFVGEDVEKTSVNEYSSKVGDTVNDIKVELRK